jgi:hypothetical protein
MEKNNNVIKKDFGYELVWAANENYGGKIIVFEKPGKTDFFYQVKTEKTWFVNEGKFLVKWVDVANGGIYQTELIPGTVHECKTLIPYCLECISETGSISEANNGVDLDDVYITLGKGSF